MTDTNWTVEGRTFRTQHDYMAGCRDKKKIDQIRKKVDFNNKEELVRLQGEIEKGTITFDTMVGSDFRDEIEERAQKLKCKPAENSKKGLFRKNIANQKSTIKKPTSKKAVSQEAALEDMEDSLKKEVIQELRKREWYRKGLLALLGVVAAGSLGYFTYYYYQADKTTADVSDLAGLKNDNRFNDKEILTENTKAETKPVIDKYKTLYQLNKKLIGWVKIADTDIDYPVMQSNDEEYYLDHDFNGEKDKNGSVFMDAKCDAMTPSTNLIIYGHNMRSGKMFGSLSDYENESFYEKHKKIIFDTIYEQGTYEVMFAFRSKLYEEAEIVFKYYQFIDPVSEEEFNSDMKEMTEMSLYDTGVTASYGDKLITLSTCDNNEKNGRFVVVAKRIEE